MKRHRMSDIEKHLPLCIHGTICTFLSIRDLIRLDQTNRFFHHFIRNTVSTCEHFVFFSTKKEIVPHKPKITNINVFKQMTPRTMRISPCYFEVLTLLPSLARRLQRLMVYQLYASSFTTLSTLPQLQCLSVHICRGLFILRYLPELLQEFVIDLFQKEAMDNDLHILYPELRSAATTHTLRPFAQEKQAK